MVKGLSSMQTTGAHSPPSRVATYQVKQAMTMDTAKQTKKCVEGKKESEEETRTQQTVRVGNHAVEGENDQRQAPFPWVPQGCI